MMDRTQAPAATRRRAAASWLAAAAVFAASTAWLIAGGCRNGLGPLGPASATVLVRLTWVPFALLALHLSRSHAIGIALARGRAELAREREAEQRRREAEERQACVAEVLHAADRLEMVYQPIVRLAASDATAVGYEALARFRTEPYASPDVWFGRAARVGLQSELELYCIQAVFAQLSQLPADSYVSVNASPETLLSAGFGELLGKVPAERIVVEITEHAVITEYGQFAEVLAGLRSHGVRVAVDDAGSGFASFRHVLEIAPEVIKLDVGLCREVHLDTARQELVRALGEFATRVGATVVAEGVETAEEAELLARFGIELGQGYLWAAPAPLSELDVRR